MKIYSFSPFGYEGSLVSVEVDLRRGIPAIDIVGLADGAVKESRERMQAAIRNSGFEFPLDRVLISLSPADLKKEGAGFDLPIALAVLAAKKDAESLNENEDVLVLGELELSGKVRPVKGVFPAASTAASAGIFKCIVPNANADEAREIPGMKVFGAETLEDAFAALENNENFTERSENDFLKSCNLENAEEIEGVLFPKVESGFEFSEIKGQKKLVRALQIAAAGGHNLIAVGAPGCGKTLSLQKFPALLPLLTKEEAQSVTRIFSLAGLLPQKESLVVNPPFRMPHQTASIEGMCGGGPHCRPGEISLAHNGVLFLDEAAEFRTSVLQMLRVPLENGKVTLARAGRSTIFPANFQLLLATNPCPCGNFGSKTKICLCSERGIELYWKKLSAPLLDRVDIRIYVENENERTEKNADSKTTTSEESRNSTTNELRLEIARAIKTQRKRQAKKNAKMNPMEVEQFCKLDKESQKFFDNAILRYGFSPRAITSCLKLSRTIADMEGHEEISAKHIKEAVELRKALSNFMDLGTEP